MSDADLDFIRAHLRVAPVAHVPEVVLYQADAAIGLWELTETRTSIHCHGGPKPPECPHPDDDPA
jgi:predicted nicotinamide N-methyase